MAASSGDDIPKQLAVLLGYPIKRIRIADEEPPRISVIDLATALTKKDANHAAQDVSYVKDRHPEVTQILGDFKFRGRVTGGAALETGRKTSNPSATRARIQNPDVDRWRSGKI